MNLALVNHRNISPRCSGLPWGSRFRPCPWQRCMQPPFMTDHHIEPLPTDPMNDIVPVDVTQLIALLHNQGKLSRDLTHPTIREHTVKHATSVSCDCHEIRQRCCAQQPGECHSQVEVGDTRLCFRHPRFIPPEATRARFYLWS